MAGPLVERAQHRHGHHREHRSRAAVDPGAAEKSAEGPSGPLRKGRKVIILTLILAAPFAVAFILLVSGKETRKLLGRFLSGSVRRVPHQCDVPEAPDHGEARSRAGCRRTGGTGGPAGTGRPSVSGPCTPLSSPLPG